MPVITNPAGPPYAAPRCPGDGTVPDRRQQEMEQARESLRQQTKHRLDVNEGGRSHDSTWARNPPGALHGLPTPSLHITWR